MAPRKFAITTTALILIGTLVISSCTVHIPANPVNSVQSEFNLAKGTTWTYSYTEYQPVPTDPTQVIPAQYQLTETVTEISNGNGLFIAHVKSEQKPIQVPTDVPANYFPISPTGEFWYVVKGQQVFQSNELVDFSRVNTDTLNLVFDFPLSVNHSWCPMRVDMKDPNHAPITNCDYGGKQTVLQQSAYQVPAGKYEDCFQIEQLFNDGNFYQWFCRNIGVVEVKFDHNGTRFGFSQVLTDYTQGSR
jgi:hypothetical protein